MRDDRGVRSGVRKVARVQSELGEGPVTVPVARPTSCCFGGDDLGTLFITTARFAMTPAELDAYPDSGDLYALRPEVGGMACHVFKESGLIGMA